MAYTTSPAPVDSTEFAVLADIKRSGGMIRSVLTDEGDRAPLVIFAGDQMRARLVDILSE